MFMISVLRRLYRGKSYTRFLSKAKPAPGVLPGILVEGSV
jgi:hypothetical protein